jgi:hypothetical protein
MVISGSIGIPCGVPVDPVHFGHNITEYAYLSLRNIFPKYEEALNRIFVASTLPERSGRHPSRYIVYFISERRFFANMHSPVFLGDFLQSMPEMVIQIHCGVSPVVHLRHVGDLKQAVL